MQIFTPFLSFFIPCAFCDFVTFWPLNHVDRRGRPNLVRRWNPKTWNAWKSRLGLTKETCNETCPSCGDLFTRSESNLKRKLDQVSSTLPASLVFVFLRVWSNKWKTHVGELLQRCLGGVTLPSAKAQDLAELSWAVKHFAELDVPFSSPARHIELSRHSIQEKVLRRCDDRIGFSWLSMCF